MIHSFLLPSFFLILLVSATANSAASSSFHNKTLSLSEFKEVSLLVAVVVAAAVAVVVAGVLYYQQLSYLVLISIVYDYSTIISCSFYRCSYNDNTSKVTFFEDGTGVIYNDTPLGVQFSYTFTERSEKKKKR